MGNIGLPEKRRLEVLGYFFPDETGCNQAADEHIHTVPPDGLIPQGHPCNCGKTFAPRDQVVNVP